MTRPYLASLPSLNRRRLLLGAAAATLAPAVPSSAAAAPSLPEATEPLKITAVELTVLRGHYDTPAGVDNQAQVNPLDIYDSLRPKPYADHPTGADKTVKTAAIYLRIRTSAGIDGLYGPIERDAAIVVHEDLRPFLLGKDALAGEALWDQLYRSNRHARAGFYLMAISAVDNTLWDIRGRFYNVPVYRLLGGPTRASVECYVSALGHSLEFPAVRKQALAFKAEGFRNQKWFLAYGPGSGEEGMRKNVEIVQLLRETLGEDNEIMFDVFSGWDLTYALEWCHQVEKYRPRWIEEVASPEKIETFATLRRSTTVPVASGEHFYGRWEVQHYLQANALSVVQADPEWCGGISELLKIGTVASLYDVPVIPHGHSIHAALHVIASQSPLTFPLAEFLAIKMAHYYHFEKHPPLPVNAHITLPTGPGFNIELDQSKIDSEKPLSLD